MTLHRKKKPHLHNLEARGTAGNKMFLQWCRDELHLCFIFVQRLVSWDRTRLRKGTTAETQTLWATIKRRNK
jgi:hypothetical protein